MNRVILICIAVLAFTASGVDLEPVADMTTTPTESFTTTGYVEVCYRPAHNHPDTRGNLLFDLSEYSGWTAESAILNLHVFYQSGCGLPTNFNAFAATEPWDESWTGTQLQHGTDIWGTFTFDGVSWYQLDITDLVNAWLSGSVANHGVVFEAVDPNQAEHRFYSRNVSSPTEHPYLTLTFPQALDQSSWGGIKASLR